jgi:hypothetical protein
MKETYERAPMPPERIYNWINTQLSIARFYGAINFQGMRYEIAPNEKGQPLVRFDVLLREAKASKAAAKAQAQAEKEKWMRAQVSLI